MDLFSGFNKSSTVPAGSLSNAPFTGAKTVNGPTFTTASSTPAASMAATKVLKSSNDFATCNAFADETSSVTADCPFPAGSVSDWVSVAAGFFSPLSQDTTKSANKAKNKMVKLIFFIIL